MQEQQQKKRLKKSYAELLEEFNAVKKKMAVVFVPKLCEALRDENPEMKNDEIKEQVMNDCMKQGWNDQYILRVIRQYCYWVVEEDPYHKRNLKMWQSRNANKLESLTQKFRDLEKIDIQEAPEPKEKDTSEELDQEMHELGIAKFGETDKSIRELKGRIYESAADLFEALTDKNTPPDESDDLIIDYIKPTREFRRSLVLELDEGDRILMHNKLHYASVAIEDMLEILKEIDK